MFQQLILLVMQENEKYTLRSIQSKSLNFLSKKNLSLSKIGVFVFVRVFLRKEVGKKRIGTHSRKVQC